MEKPDFDTYINTFDEQIKKYIPTKEAWTPVDDALYKPRDLFRIPLKEAADMLLKSMKYTFTHQYNNNKMYQNFCKERSFSPSDLKTADDLDKIPLIPDSFFKDYPGGRDFALWLGNIFTGTLPRIVIKQQNPTYDEVINAFNAAGMAVAYSSGTSGRHTFIPRDQRTFYASEYAVAKSTISMMYPLWNPHMHGYVLMPNPKKTNVYAGKVCTIYFDAIQDVRVAIDRDITTELIQMTMTGQKGIKTKVVKYFAKRESEKMINEIIRWLEYHEKTKEKIALVGAPFILSFVMKRLEAEGRSFEFGERAGVATGGGWKAYEGARVPVVDFRKQVEKVLGIPEKYCLDIYGMVEGNGWMVHCPEGHYLHSPYSYYKPLVLDAEYKPVGYGEWGRYAFLDAAAFSYPGFIISGDKVRMLEHCPVCDRPGPVLEPEIKRATGEEIRGCAEEVRRMLSADLGVDDK
jgi:phenylacetate-coenzyme A ligase PaaK-like adenylate-forming protein